MTASPGATGPRSAPDPDAQRAPERADLAKVAALRALLSAGVLAVGLRAISDDDYSRVVIAQQWARAPRLDPSGTSWLPFPFWTTGGAMLAFGRSLFVAQAVALALGVGSAVLVAIAASRVLPDRRSAIVGAWYAALVGWAAWLGVATVPEYPTAALSLFAASALATRSARARFAGAGALFVATLSRYETWPVAAAFAVWNAVDAVRARGRPDGVAGGRTGTEPSSNGRGAVARTALLALLPALVALAGPLLWIAWNRAAHGDAFHFVSRVTAYRRALGEAQGEGVLARLVAYPIALAREMPEVAIPAALVAVLAIVPRFRPAIVASLRRTAAPLALSAAQVVALAAALAKDGAPTHHPERAVLFPALAIALFVAGAAGSLVPKVPRLVPIAIGIGLFARAVATPLFGRDAFARRDSEIAMGDRVRSGTPADTRVLVEVTDYGHFAIEARSGAPERFVLDRDLDPRHPTERPVFGDEEAFVAWLRQQGIRWVISPRAEGAPVSPRFRGGSAALATDRHLLSEVPAEGAEGR